MTNQKQLLQSLCETLHLDLAQKLTDLVNATTEEDNDPRILTVARKFLADNGITLELHYDEADIPKPGDTPPALDTLKKGVLPFATRKSASS